MAVTRVSGFPTTPPTDLPRIHYVQHMFTEMPADFIGLGVPLPFTQGADEMRPFHERGMGVRRPTPPGQFPET